MILDHENLFSEDQALTASAVSTNYIDLGADRDLGNGEPLEILVAVGTTFTSGTSAATLTIAVQSDNDEAFGSPSVVQRSSAIPVADLTAGEQVFKVKIGSPTERYVRLDYTVGTENFTAGQLTAGLVLDRANVRSYPSGFSIA